MRNDILKVSVGDVLKNKKFACTFVVVWISPDHLYIITEYLDSMTQSYTSNWDASYIELNLDEEWKKIDI